MFLYEQKNSVNRKQDLPAGLYRSISSVYQSMGSDARAVLMEYGLVNGFVICAVELLVINPEGDQFHWDFMQMKDGRWRDGSGNFAESVGELFPPEIIDFRLLEKRELSTQEVGGAQ